MAVDGKWNVKIKTPMGEQGGTLAGENVAQFGKWTDRWGRERDDFPAFLTNIRTTALSQPAALDARST